LTASVTLIVLIAALMHASWNALVKGATDKAVALGMIALGHVVLGLPFALTSQFPNIETLGFITASTVIHWAYYVALNTAYRLGDLSVIYPIARGLAPVLIAIGAQVWADEVLPVVAWAGILTVSTGILLLAWGRGTIPREGLIAALGTALLVAAYSVVDGVGVRTSQSAVTYISWLFVSEIFVVLFVLARFRARIAAAGQRAVLMGLIGGVTSGVAYGLVLYAKTLAPLGLVSALRETSVVFAALFGIFLFGEGPRSRRLVAATVVAGGIALMSLA